MVAVSFAHPRILSQFSTQDAAESPQSGHLTVHKKGLGSERAIETERERGRGRQTDSSACTISSRCSHTSSSDLLLDPYSVHYLNPEPCTLNPRKTGRAQKWWQSALQSRGSWVSWVHLNSHKNNIKTKTIERRYKNNRTNRKTVPKKTQQKDGTPTKERWGAHRSGGSQPCRVAGPWSFQCTWFRTLSSTRAYTCIAIIVIFELGYFPNQNS